MYFSVRQSSFGSFLSSVQVKQTFSEEQVAHNEGQALQTGFVEEDLKKYPVEHWQVPWEQELAQFAWHFTQTPLRLKLQNKKKGIFKKKKKKKTFYWYFYYPEKQVVLQYPFWLMNPSLQREGEAGHFDSMHVIQFSGHFPQYYLLELLSVNSLYPSSQFNAVLGAIWEQSYSDYALHVLQAALHFKHMFEP